MDEKELALELTKLDVKILESNSKNKSANKIEFEIHRSAIDIFKENLWDVKVMKSNL